MKTRVHIYTIIFQLNLINLLKMTLARCQQTENKTTHQPGVTYARVLEYLIPVNEISLHFYSASLNTTAALLKSRTRGHRDTLTPERDDNAA